jgi:hypothetical protein
MLFRMGHFLPLVILASLQACATVPQVQALPPDSHGLVLLRQSAGAQGYSSLTRLHDVTVHYDGHWSPFIASIQPTLVDDQFRGSSDETYLVGRPVVTQTDAGPGGIKQVVRDGASISVSYNHVQCTDAAKLDAAAVVADGYRMFLLGPAFFLQRGGTVRYLGRSGVDGMECDDVLVDLKPGIGRSAGDRVVVSIDRQMHYVRRVRMTVNGLAGAQGGIGDIFLRGQVRIHGVVWPTIFYEELKAPADLPVHHWRMTSIDFDRDAATTTKPF